MILENRVNEFKVGKGRDLDVSGDVEEGKIEVELQGKTCQNLVEYIADYEGYEKNGFYYSKNASRKLSFGLKPNTVYTRILDVKECFEPFWMYDSINNSDGTYRQYSYKIKQGLVINKFTSSDLGTINSYTFNPDQNVTNKENFNIVIGRMILLEGDHTQTPLEELPKYFEGIKSSFEDGVVDIEVQGKNLFDGVYRFDYLQGGDVTIYCERESGDTRLALVKVEPYTTYTIKKESSVRNTMALFKEFPKDGDYYKGIVLSDLGTTIKTGDNNYLAVYVSNESEEPFLQVEKLNYPTPYEPYYKKKISFNIGEPLRSLPNGICDEIRNNNGQWELVRKIGKVVLDGSEGWYNSTAEDGASKYFTANDVINDIKRTMTLNNQINSHFVIRNPYQYPSESCMWALWQNSSRIRISIKNISDLSEIKNWLSQNPTTIYYELETPIITPIEPIEFEVKPLATMTINSEIAPISNHKVVLNRAGQIEQGIIQIAELKSRVDALETAYDSYLLETQHKLSLLGFEYELESEEV